MIDNDDYGSLQMVLDDAFKRASQGKGKERHASGEAFEAQPIVNAIVLLGEHCWDGQIVKKMLEVERLEPAQGDAELLDVIVYAAARVVARRLLRGERVA